MCIKSASTSLHFVNFLIINLKYSHRHVCNCSRTECIGILIIFLKPYPKYWFHSIAFLFYSPQQIFVKRILIFIYLLKTFYLTKCQAPKAIFGLMSLSPAKFAWLPYSSMISIPCYSGSERTHVSISWYHTKKVCWKVISLQHSYVGICRLYKVCLIYTMSRDLVIILCSDYWSRLY